MAIWTNTTKTLLSLSGGNDVQLTLQCKETGNVAGDQRQEISDTEMPQKKKKMKKLDATKDENNFKKK